MWVGCREWGVGGLYRAVVGAEVLFVMIILILIILTVMLILILIILTVMIILILSRASSSLSSPSSL